MSVIPFVENPTVEDLLNIGRIEYSGTSGISFCSSIGSPQLHIARILDKVSFEAFFKTTVSEYPFYKCYAMWVETRPLSSNYFNVTTAPYNSVENNNFSRWNRSNYVVGFRWFAGDHEITSTGIYSDNIITTYNTTSDWIADNDLVIYSVLYPITYSSSNSTVSGPSEAGVGDTVTVSAVPNAGCGITDASTQILVTNNDVAVPYTWDAATNHITFTMPDPS